MFHAHLTIPYAIPDRIREQMHRSGVYVLLALLLGVSVACSATQPPGIVVDRATAAPPSTNTPRLPTLPEAIQTVLPTGTVTAKQAVAAMMTVISMPTGSYATPVPKSTEELANKSVASLMVDVLATAIPGSKFTADDMAKGIVGMAFDEASNSRQTPMPLAKASPLASAAAPRITPTARPTTPPTLTPTPLPGQTRSNAVPFGKALRFKNGWTVEVLGIEKNGDAIIKQANRFNEAAGPGRKYVILHAKAEYNGEEEPQTVDPYDWKLVGKKAKLYSPASVVVKDEMEGKIFKGGSVEGFVAYNVEADDDNFIAVYDRLMDFNAPAAYLATE